MFDAILFTTLGVLCILYTIENSNQNEATKAREEAKLSQYNWILSRVRSESTSGNFSYNIDSRESLSVLTINKLKEQGFKLKFNEDGQYYTISWE